MLLFLITIPFVVVVAVITLIQLIRFAFKKIGLPKKTLIAFTVVSTISMTSFLYNHYFFTFQKIDRTYLQEGPSEIASPNGQLLASAFYEPYGGAVGGVNVWVEVTNVATQEMKVIYYADAKTTVSLTWEDDEHLTIRNEDSTYEDANATATLHVFDEIYDEFGRACRSLLMKDQYETCYES